MSSLNSDLDRLHRVYTQRDQFIQQDIYSVFNTAHLFLIYQRQRAIIELLRQVGITTLRDKRILEIGCGHGAVLREFIGLGATPNYLFGIDFMADRATQAHQLLSVLPLAVADAQHLPYSSKRFDLILQYTVFTSILDTDIKVNVAREMQRVLKPSGLILWYDFWLNPTNPQTRGIRLKEIRTLFPNGRFRCRRITLAPPIARRVVPISWLLAALLEKMAIVNSHYLVAIHSRQ